MSKRLPAIAPAPKGLAWSLPDPQGRSGKDHDKGGLGKGVYRGDKAEGMTGGIVLDDLKIAEQFLPICLLGRCEGVPR
jgi:hypothetical protein